MENNMVLSLATAALGGSALQTLGGLFQNKKQVSSAREQMAFQERMSNTSYQRGMKDMQKAGLNPILAYQKGGASAPGGAQPNIRNPFESATSAAANYVAAKKANAEINNIESQTRLNAANTAVQLEKANTEILNQGQIRSQTGLTRQTTAKEGYLTEQERIRVETAFAQLGKTRMESLQAESLASRLVLQGNIDRSELGQLLAYLERAKQLGLGLDTVTQLLGKKGKSKGFPALPGKHNNFKPKKDSFEVFE
ncbi:DNA pilot protein [Microviridae sp.]|nr:DNA pilot protein [Microviridae sp.]